MLDRNTMQATDMLADSDDYGTFISLQNVAEAHQKHDLC